MAKLFHYYFMCFGVHDKNVDQFRQEQGIEIVFNNKYNNTDETKKTNNKQQK